MKLLILLSSFFLINTVQASTISNVDICRYAIGTLNDIPIKSIQKVQAESDLFLTMLEYIRDDKQKYKYQCMVEADTVKFRQDGQVYWNKNQTIKYKTVNSSLEIEIYVLGDLAQRKEWVIKQ